MNDTSSWNRPIPYLFAFVDLRCDRDLDGTARLVSSILCGGIEFGGREDFVRDEVPALYTLAPVLGLRFVLYGYGGDAGYTLEVGPQDYPWIEGPDSGLRGRNEVDLSAYLAALMARSSEIIPG